MAMLKSLPLDGSYDDPSLLAHEQPLLSGFPTPLVTLSERALRHNVATMARWTQERGVQLAPHGKTTMSRELWQRQLDAGAWGITVATPWQLSVALDWDVPRVMLANALVQPAAIRALAPRLADHQVLVWADSLRTVEILDSTLAQAEAPEPLGVLVELGSPGARTGARTRRECLDVARAVADSPWLRLAGVAAYEGAVAHTTAEADLAAVRAYLREAAALHAELAEAGLYAGAQPGVVTAGGSVYFDLVTEELGPLAGERTQVILRSGAYVTHDDGFYREVTPLNRVPGGQFLPAIHGWASVISRPEPGLVLVDGGRRDFPFDEGLPEPQAVRRFGSQTLEPLTGAVTTAVNDQHAFVTVAEDCPVQVGDVIRFGLSHPCTTFDKWQALPLVDDTLGSEPRVIGLVETAFG